jgi:hypothetical protein
MQREHNSIAVILSLLALAGLAAAEDQCTTAVISGAITVDGRPLLWKNRDTDQAQNEVVYFSGGTYAVVAVIDAGSSGAVWMGLNSAGFAIENSYSPDLEGENTGENGVFMKTALFQCAGVEDFERLLVSTNTAGRGTKANFGVIDASGGAAVFETGNHTFTRFDADGPSATLSGCVIRTNFGLTGNGTGSGRERYNRAVDLAAGRLSGLGLSHEFILREMARDLWTERADPYPLPFQGSVDSLPAGFIETSTSINRNTTCSSVVFQGVSPGEDSRLSTMWVILGEPVYSVALPVWPWAGAAPEELGGDTGSPMCRAAIMRRAACYPLETATAYLDTAALDDGLGGGLWIWTFALEDWVFSETAGVLADWRSNPPAADHVARFENDLAARVFACYCYGTAPAGGLEAPIDFSCLEVENRGFLQAETIHVLSWNPPGADSAVAGYRLYRDNSGAAELLAELGSSRREFLCRGVDPLREQTYFLVAVDTEGKEGLPAVIYRFDLS